MMYCFDTTNKHIFTPYILGSFFLKYILHNDYLVKKKLMKRVNHKFIQRKSNLAEVELTNTWHSEKLVELSIAVTIDRSIVTAK